MSEAKHTPGPWKAEFSPTNGWNPGIWGPDEILVASCRVAHWRTSEENQANTLLIAAAPDLYAALKDAEEELRLLRMKDTNVVYDPTLRAKISIAIAKAEGRL